MFSDEALMELPPAVRLTGLGLRFYADDEGRGSANPTLIKASLWPLDQDTSETDIEEHLVALEDAGYIHLYSVDGRTYIALDEWPATDRGAASRLPPPPDPPDPPALASPSRGPREVLAVVEEGEGREGGGAGEEAPGGGGGPREAPARLPTGEPSPFCSKHQPYGTERPCGGCAAARTKHRMWLRDQTDDATTDLDVPA
ncbi:hypothetical protein [Pseudactinotalea suaedae]|uniref:hypothetical protein n=1 Tax=Pseudactinotalea suaedae TaxID=1524924 RepID=UPI0012E2D1DC|nr:hypothetical protein [Pseudactinotalea suaedae]